MIVHNPSSLALVSANLNKLPLPVIIDRLQHGKPFTNQIVQTFWERQLVDFSGKPGTRVPGLKGLVPGSVGAGLTPTQSPRPRHWASQVPSHIAYPYERARSLGLT